MKPIHLWPPEKWPFALQLFMICPPFGGPGLLLLVILLWWLG